MKKLLFFALLFYPIHLLIAQDKPILKLQSGHSDQIYCLKFSPNGKLLASSGKDGKVVFWDMETFRELKVFYPKREGVWDIEFSRDGSLLFTASGNDAVFSIYDMRQDSLLKAWSVEYGRSFTFTKNKSRNEKPDEHNRSIVAMALSKEDNYLATAGWDGKLLLWDSNSGDYLGGGIATGKRLTSVAYNDGKKNWVAIGDDGGNLMLLGLEKSETKMLMKASEEDFNEVADLAFSTNGKYLFSLEDDAVLKVWDTDTFQNIHTYSKEKSANFDFNEKFILSTDGKYLISDVNLNVYLIEENGNLRYQKSLSEGTFTALALSEDNQYLAGSINGQILLLDFQTGKLITPLKSYAYPLYGLLSKDAKEFTYYAGQPHFISWDLENAKMKPKITLDAKPFSYFDVSLANHQFISVEEDRVGGEIRYKVFEKKSNKLVDEFTLKGDSEDEISNKDYYISDNGKLLAFVLSDDSIGRFGVRDVAQRKILCTIDAYIESDTVTKYLRSIEFTQDNRYVLASIGNNTIKMWNVANGKLVKTFKTGTPDSFSSLLGLKLTVNDITELQISPNNQMMVTAGMSENGNLILWDFEKGTMIRTYSGHQKYIKALAFSPDNRFFVSGGDDDKLIKIWDTQSDKLLKTLEGHTGAITHLIVTPDLTKIISVSNDNTVRYWDISSGTEIARLIIAGNHGEDYVIVTSDGYYMATKEGVKTVHFIKNNKVYTFDQFDIQYNRPDKVLETLGCPDKELIEFYRKAYEKRIKKMGFNLENLEKERNFNVPTVQLTNLSNYFFQVQTPDYQIEIAATDNLYYLDRLNIWVNGVPIFGSQGKDLKNLKSKTITDKATIQLNQGKNIIEISVLNEKGVESLKERFEVQYAPTTTRKGNLYLITINVGKFKDSKMNLNYAVKDGKDITKAFSEKNKKISPTNSSWNKVIIQNLYNEDATLENILKLRQQLSKTTVDDVVMVFVSSHGLLNKNLDYYIATADIDFKAPESRGLRYEVLEGLMDGIPARQKVLMLDACHSGEVDKDETFTAQIPANQSGIKGILKSRSFQEEKSTETTETEDLNTEGISSGGVGLLNSFELMKELFTDLRRNSGTTVISAAGGEEFALEGADWNNGVFTYALLTGLQEMKADADQDGTIMLSEIKNYVQKIVPQLTGGRQQPTSRIENLQNDFKIW